MKIGELLPCRIGTDVAEAPRFTRRGLAVRAAGDVQARRVRCIREIAFSRTVAFVSGV